MILRILAVFTLLISSAFAQDKPAAHTQGTPTGRPAGPLKPGEYWWNPQISPNGPVIALVSIPLQTMNVYRNGILIGRSSVSTGAKGHGTPSGVFTILEKKQKHFSKKYDNAPMPNMQRLTWTGIAMHSGNIPGYPASHGCIRMPWDFSRLLFSVTAKGGTVVIGDGKTPQPHLAASPGVMLAPKDFTPEMLRPLANNGYDWRPERSPPGPITILISGADRTMYVYRNGNPIGRAAIEVIGSGYLGSHVFSMLEGVSENRSFWTPGRAAKKWMCVNSTNYRGKIDPDRIARRLRFNPEFAAKLYEVVAPGTTVIVTDQPAVRKPARDLTILTN
ncbi:MAG TPA: L,D-transpeptidase [Verrucomicrobiales bacterium]|nr:L,D-transpeptidase [Verrucomicrobiales bacterium]